MSSHKDSVPFECSQTLDKNSLLALRAHDEEDGHMSNATSAYSKQKLKQDGFKKFIPGCICDVCGDMATGIHYNVIACNGCKTFFRRCLLNNASYSCKQDGDCPINKDLRNSCRHCRFKKCLSVGMDSSELNIERRRKRKIIEHNKSEVLITEIADPLISDLMTKENKFCKMLTSNVAPIHNNLAEALNNEHSAFDNFEYYESNQLAAEDQMNFSYWRAKILSTMIEWAKTFDEFRNLSFSDKEALIIHTSFSSLVLSEAFHTPERYLDRIVFPDGLSGFRNLTANILKEHSGLIPTVVSVINNILVPIRKIRMTEVEYLLLQAIILFDPECITLSTSAVDIIQTKRTTLLKSLQAYLNLSLNDAESAYRNAALLLRIPNVHKVASHTLWNSKQIYRLEMFIYSTIETFNLMRPHPLTMELSKKYPESSFF